MEAQTRWPGPAEAPLDAGQVFGRSLGNLSHENAEMEPQRCSSYSIRDSFLLHAGARSSIPNCGPLSHVGVMAAGACPGGQGDLYPQERGTDLPAKEVAHHHCWVAEVCPGRPTQLPEGFVRFEFGSVSLLQTALWGCRQPLCPVGTGVATLGH